MDNGSEKYIPSHDLADFPFFGAVHIRVERRETRYRDISREEVELWDTVPGCAFGRKHVDQEDFGLDMLVPPSFEDRQWLRDCQGNARECS